MSSHKYVVSASPVEGTMKLTDVQIKQLGLGIYLVLDVPVTASTKVSNENKDTNKPNKKGSSKANNSNNVETSSPSAPVKKEKKVKERKQVYCFYGMSCPHKDKTCKRLHDESHPATHCCVRSCTGTCGLKHKKPKKAKSAKKQDETTTTNATEEQSDDSDSDSESDNDDE